MWERNARSRWLAGVAVILMALPLTACEWVQVGIRIPDFESSQVEGVWIWRFSEETEEFERVAQIQMDPESSEGGSIVSYQIDYGEGTEPYHLWADLVPDEDPDALNVVLWYPRVGAPGFYRASSYNAAGESPLSAEMVAL